MLCNFVFHRLTFRRVIKKGNVEEFSCVPYILALFNCLLYTWYGLPVVSSGWENMTVSTINGLGILLEIAFISINVWFAPREKKASDQRRVILFRTHVSVLCKLLNIVNRLSDGLFLAEVCLWIGASCSDVIWLDSVFIKLLCPYTPYAQGFCG